MIDVEMSKWKPFDFAQISTLTDPKSPKND